MKLISKIKTFFSSKERIFEPDFSEIDYDKHAEYPPFVRRKWKQIALAMKVRDTERVNELQCQLMEAGYPVPKTLTEAEELCRD